MNYEEKLYAVGKIPGGFTKREGKASENAVLTARVIDRPMRPLFPKDYRNDVTLDNIVMSVDPECSPELTAMLGSAIATSISDIPFDGPCATTQVGLIDGEFIINPTAAQKKVSDLALTVASTREKVIMIEAGANEVPEDTMIEAIFKAARGKQGDHRLHRHDRCRVRKRKALLRELRDPGRTVCRHPGDRSAGGDGRGRIYRR